MLPAVHKIIRITLTALVLCISNRMHARQSIARTVMTAGKSLAGQAVQTIKAHPKLAYTIGAVHGLGFLYGAYQGGKYPVRLAKLQRELAKLEREEKAGKSLSAQIQAKKADVALAEKACKGVEEFDAQFTNFK